MSDLLNINKQTDCWIFNLNRPEKMNALSPDLVEALIKEVEQANEKKIASLVFRGNGKNFSAGFDLTNYESQSDGDLLLRLVRIETLLNMVASSPCLTVGLAHGKNFGAGVDLFAVCKQRYCTPDTTFRMPGLKFGLVLGTQRFRDIVGKQNALAILGDTKTFTAKEAECVGFVQEISNRDDWAVIIDSAKKTATTLDPESRAQFYNVIHENHADRHMAALVYSAARPGLKTRIAHYLKQ